MVRRLAAQGLIRYERYRGVRLSPAGRRAALRTIRRHRVIEAYLTTALHYPEDRVHDEAERIEHAASDELIDRMSAAIGEPDTDPHGAPIPTREACDRGGSDLRLVQPRAE
jgi:DtxR family Mn-dependent transcriptional regulator